MIGRIQNHFYYALRAHGYHNWKHLVIDAGLSRNDAYELERQIVSEEKLIKLGYNTVEGGRGGFTSERAKKANEKLGKIGRSKRSIAANASMTAEARSLRSIKLNIKNRLKKLQYDERHTWVLDDEHITASVFELIMKYGHLKGIKNAASLINKPTFTRCAGKLRWLNRTNAILT